MIGRPRTFLLLGLGAAASASAFVHWLTHRSDWVFIVLGAGGLFCLMLGVVHGFQSLARRVVPERPVGSCPDCGYSNEGLGSTTCPECGGRLPPSDLHIKGLLAVHAARGPAECVVCGLLLTDAPAGAPCPSCGSRRRRPPPAPPVG